jgi:hypothetical protein
MNTYDVFHAATATRRTHITLYAEDVTLKSINFLFLRIDDSQNYSS